VLPWQMKWILVLMDSEIRVRWITSNLWMVGLEFWGVLLGADTHVKMRNCDTNF